MACIPILSSITSTHLASPPPTLSLRTHLKHSLPLPLLHKNPIFLASLHLRHHQNHQFHVSPVSAKRANLPYATSFTTQTSDLEEEEADEEETVGGGHGFDWGQKEEEVGGGQKPTLESESLRLFVGNLRSDVDGEKLAQLFARAGEVEFAEVIYDRQTDQSRGFGFVTMVDPEDSEKAIDMFNNYELDSRKITVNKATPRGSKPLQSGNYFRPSHKIYVGNLPWQVDDAQLEELFGEHGTVINARIVYDRETGRSRGFGFVRMSIESKVDDVIAALDGKIWNGRVIRVDVAEEKQ